MRLGIVTATTDPERSRPCIADWRERASGPIDTFVVQNGVEKGGGWFGNIIPSTGEKNYVYLMTEIVGVVPAFALGVQKALEMGCTVIAALHDDLEIHQEGWDQIILDHFQEHPKAGLLGFGGGRGLGADNLYQVPYHPMQLARQDFVSNMVDAESHGRRVEEPLRVACLDGFSQVGRSEFWEGGILCQGVIRDQLPERVSAGNLFAIMQQWGVIHHFYDGCLGCFAKRLGWEVWMLPVTCRHLGGQTAVGDSRYQQWAKTQHPDGDAGLWARAHEIGYTTFRDVLPLCTKEETWASSTSS